MTIDEIETLWDEYFVCSDKDLIEMMTLEHNTKEQLDKASEERFDAILAYWKFKRILEYAEIEDETPDISGS